MYKRQANPVSFTVDWLEMTRIELLKQDADTRNPLDGAVYGIYTDSKCAVSYTHLDVYKRQGVKGVRPMDKESMALLDLLGFCMHLTWIL